MGLNIERGDVDWGDHLIRRSDSGQFIRTIGWTEVDGEERLPLVLTVCDCEDSEKSGRRHVRVFRGEPGDDAVVLMEAMLPRTADPLVDLLDAQRSASLQFGELEDEEARFEARRN